MMTAVFTNDKLMAAVIDRTVVSSPSGYVGASLLLGMNPKALPADAKVHARVLSIVVNCHEPQYAIAEEWTLDVDGKVLDYLKGEPQFDPIEKGTLIAKVGEYLCEKGAAGAVAPKNHEWHDGLPADLGGKKSITI